MKFDRKRFVADLLALSERSVIFRHQGDSPESGLDCIHLPRWAYRKQGLELPAELDLEFDSYTENPDGWRMLAIMQRWFWEVTIPGADTLTQFQKAQPGDLLQFYVYRNPKHMGVKVNETDVYEAFRSMDGSIREARKMPIDPRRRIAGVFRIPDFA
jgi:cell wall-associated NlpC family hydrolase